MLGREERTVGGRLALALGVPASRAIAAVQARRQPAGPGTWGDASTDYTLEPNPFHDSIRRR
ncbi:hypothetical protein [Microbacterium sp.]|uniref:hypothetical protein n=1 Tax=Microbacterium sp. TaxID=51671 RepID=UPI0039E5C1F9